MELPKDFLVDTGRLAGCFKHTSATYKFYWMLGMLAEVEQGKERVEKKALFAHMVAGAWYTVNYFKVSFGASDQLQQAIGQIKELEGLAVDAAPEAIHRRLMQSKKPETQRVQPGSEYNTARRRLQRAPPAVGRHPSVRAFAAGLRCGSCARCLPAPSRAPS